MITVFVVLDSSSPRKLLNAFELFELQNSFDDVAVVLCFAKTSQKEIRELLDTAQFLTRMNLVLDMGSSDSFLRGQEAAFMTFAEDEEKDFTDLQQVLDYL